MSDITPIQMYDSSGSTADAVASIDIPQNGRILGLDWSMRAEGMAADADLAQYDLSFVSTNQRTTNDARGTISSCMVGISAATAASIAGTFANKFVDLKDGIGVSAGERLYLHLDTTANTTSTVVLIVYFKFGTAVARRSARRR